MAYLTYKGYFGSIEPQLDDNKLYGKLLFIRDLVTYEADTLAELKKEFEASVDAYLEDCEELGREPDKPCKGTFNVRIPPELHRKIVLAAGDKSLNQFVREVLEEKLAHNG
ncbi:type II toxin-antitoxin system HicB family antitoxin [Methylohalobius crimeensis]|uniref:type II toxin-antitoxin system HicB family antitoxin n=1 Tax=Methylohalobius crimeensis TaxID=244365 RepID=UPI00041516C4|nr:type II toxin-antitoxin system HicB family antitoxin [Methylohalobius crimeensis]